MNSESRPINGKRQRNEPDRLTAVMRESAGGLKRKLLRVGLSREAIDSAWPTWWSEDADSSPSARADLRFSLCRKLGIDSRTLLKNGRIEFLWNDKIASRYISKESNFEKAAIGSFCISIGSLLIHMTHSSSNKCDMSAQAIRHRLVRRNPLPEFRDIVSCCWSIGIPVIHLRVFPVPRNRMSAMSVRMGSRFAIILGEHSPDPTESGFHVAHELGHIALGHLNGKNAIVDFDRTSIETMSQEEERNADEYAFELLVGNRNRIELSATFGRDESTLVQAVRNASEKSTENPIMLALFFAFRTGQWDTYFNVRRQFTVFRPATKFSVNEMAERFLYPSRIGYDSQPFLKKILGRVSKT